MKKVYHLLLVLLVPCCLHAQPTLHHCESYSAGTRLQYAICKTIGITPGDKGANQTWDFSALHVTDSSVSEVKANPSNSPYPSATYMIEYDALSYSASYYDYYIDTGNIVSLIGFYRSPLEDLHYQTPILIAKNPITYNDTLTDTTVIIMTRPQRDSIIDYRYSKADGYGTLITPPNTFPNTLRITLYSKEMEYLYDSLSSTTDTFLNNYITTSWYDTGHSAALLTIIMHNTPTDTNYIVDEVEYLQKEDLNVNTIDKLKAYFANADSKQLTVACNFNEYHRYHIILYNLFGQKIYDAHFVPSYDRAQFPIDNLTPGIYIAAINSDDNFSEKVTIKVCKMY